MTDLEAVKADLTERFERLDTLQQCIKQYKETRGDHLELQKKVACASVARGALRYLEALTECF